MDGALSLERVPHELGYPETIPLDIEPEFISKELDLCAFVHGVTLDFSRPGKPTDNAFIESQRQVPGRVLERELVHEPRRGDRKCEAWRRDDNEVRPHSAIGHEVPAALHRTARNPGQPAVR